MTCQVAVFVFQGETHHVVAREQFLQKLCLFVLHCLNDKLIVAGQVEPGTAGPGVGEFDQRFIAHRVLREQKIFITFMTSPSGREPGCGIVKHFLYLLSVCVSLSLLQDSRLV